MELDQCRRPDQRAKLRQAARAHEQRGQADEDAIGRSEIGRPLPGAITDEQLVLEQQRLGGDGADAAGAKELREGDQQVDGKDEDFTHRANRTTTASACKAARRVRIASHCEFATHRLWNSCPDDQQSQAKWSHAKLTALYGAAASGMGSAVFTVRGATADSLMTEAMAAYRHFVGASWDKRKSAWETGFKELYRHAPSNARGIDAELHALQAPELESAATSPPRCPPSRRRLPPTSRWSDPASCHRVPKRQETAPTRRSPAPPAPWAVPIAE